MNRPNLLTAVYRQHQFASRQFKQAALDLSVNYANQRKSYGKPIAEMHTIQWLLTEIDSRLEAARWWTYRVASHRDRGANIRRESSLPINMLYRDAKMTEVHEGVSEIQRILIAKSLTQGFCEI